MRTSPRVHLLLVAIYAVLGLSVWTVVENPSAAPATPVTHAQTVDPVFDPGALAQERALMAAATSRDYDRKPLHKHKHRAHPQPVEKPVEAAPAPAPVPASSAGIPAVWVALMGCEAGSYGWTANTGNGYYGGFQFSLGTWSSYGGTGLPSAASPAQQLVVARKVLAAQGVGAWPVCGPRVGLSPGD